jgi:hypothetical protein
MPLIAAQLAHSEVGGRSSGLRPRLEQHQWATGLARHGGVGGRGGMAVEMRLGWERKAATAVSAHISDDMADEMAINSASLRCEHYVVTGLRRHGCPALR